MSTAGQLPEAAEPAGIAKPKKPTKPRLTKLQRLKRDEQILRLHQRYLTARQIGTLVNLEKQQVEKILRRVLQDNADAEAADATHLRNSMLARSKERAASLAGILLEVEDVSKPTPGGTAVVKAPKYPPKDRIAAARGCREEDDFVATLYDMKPRTRPFPADGSAVLPASQRTEAETLWEMLELLEDPKARELVKREYNRRHGVAASDAASEQKAPADQKLLGGAPS